MSEAARLREEIAEAGHRMVSLGLTHGATGNISARLSDGTALITPTGVSLGRIDPAQICHLDASGGYLSGAKPTKELPLHQAFYETRGARTGRRRSSLRGSPRPAAPGLHLQRSRLGVSAPSSASARARDRRTF